VKARHQTADVYIRITNPVSPVGVSPGGEGNRMAIKNIRDRLQVLYSDRASLRAELVGEEFVTEVRFPVMAESEIDGNENERLV